MNLQREHESGNDGFFYVEWTGRPCPFCGEAGVSGKSPAGHFFAGCPDADCLAHNLAYDFVTVDHARAAWNQRYETSGNEANNPRVSIDMCAHGADRGSYCGYCGGYSKGAHYPPKDAFHWKDDVFFTAFPNGSVECRRWGIGLYFHMSAESWNSVVAFVERQRLASADTRPEGGDSTKIEAPFTSGAVPKADAQNTPSHTEGGER
jgi:hypothetical protein